MSQLIAIISQKGGVGKTSTAVNLGASLSAIKRRVLLVGMDPQCGLGSCFGLQAPRISCGLLELLRDGASASEAIHRSHPRLPRLDVMPANVVTSADERYLVDALRAKQDFFVETLGLLGPSYDYIFMDCPPRLDHPTTAALAAADSYMVPIQCEYAAMASVGRALRGALEVKQLYNPGLSIFGFLLTMADKRAHFTVKVIQEVRQYLKDRVFKTIIPRDPHIAEVPNRAEPVIAFDMESPGGKAYVQLAREILGAAKAGQTMRR